MKKLILIPLAAVALLAAGCKKELINGPTEGDLSKSYIGDYAMVEWVNGYQYPSENLFDFTFKIDDNAETTHEKIDSLTEHFAEHFGDTTYNKRIPFYNKPRVYLSDIESMTISSDVTAFDADHPAGSSLNDIVKVYITSYLPFIRSGYKAFDWDNYTGDYAKPNNQNLYLTEKLASELTPEDFTMISRFSFKFTVPPPSEVLFTLRIRFYKSDGSKIETLIGNVIFP